MFIVTRLFNLINHLIDSFLFPIHLALHTLAEYSRIYIHSKKSLLIVKLRSFQNSCIEIKQISFLYQQIRFTVKKTQL